MKLGVGGGPQGTWDGGSASEKHAVARDGRGRSRDVKGPRRDSGDGQGFIGQACACEGDQLIKRPGKKDKIHIFYTNARSIRNKKDEFFGTLAVENCDIACIVESWVSEDVLGDYLHEYEAPGYQLFASMRKGMKGGGILLYIKRELMANEVANIKQDHQLETVWVDIKMRFGKHRSLRLGVFYRPPSQGRELDEALCREISRGTTHTSLLIGDFNLPGIESSHCTAIVRTFQECFEDNFLHQNVLEPTRGAEILDLVLSSENSVLVQNLTVGESLGGSDHSIIRFNIAGQVDIPTNSTKIPNFAKGDYNKLQGLLGTVEWEGIFSGLDAHQMWDLFKEILEEFQGVCIPQVAIRKKRLKPRWLNRGVAAKIRNKKRAFENFKACQLGQEKEVCKEEYKRANREAKKAIRQSKRQSEISFANQCKGDMKKFFSFYKFSGKEKTGIGPLQVRGKILDSDSEMACALSEHFASVFTVEDDLSELLTGGEVVRQNEGSLGLVEITRQEVLQKLMHLDSSKAAGPDNMFPKVLKEAASELATPLHIIFSRSLEYAEIPDDWKWAHVVPIFKGGCKGDTGNYRPVSLTSQVCKILERILKDKIVTFLDDQKLIGDSQHGFRKGRSCLTNILNFLEYVTQQIDEGKPLDVVYLDFSKAFDKVPHQRLLLQLKNHGISGAIWDWVREWLNARRQRVILNGQKSEWSQVLSGVPQGSVLGPLLFIIFINHIDEGVSSRVFKFADDLKIVNTVGGEQGHQTIQGDLDTLNEWASKWQMKFNYSKCKVMHLGGQNDHHSYEMGSSFLGNTAEEKDLGVWIDSTLSSSRQCKEARKKGLRMLGAINRNVSYKSKTVMMKLYTAYVRPHLEYCVQAWSPFLRRDIEALERVQRRATRMVEGLAGQSYEDRLKALNLFSLGYRRLRGDMIEMYKVVQGMDSVDRNMFHFREGRTLRGHMHTLRKDFCRTRMRQKFFSQRVVGEWNRLPAEVVSAGTLSEFKARLDKFNTGEGKIYSY